MTQTDPKPFMTSMGTKKNIDVIPLGERTDGFHILIGCNAEDSSVRIRNANRERAMIDAESIAILAQDVPLEEAVVQFYQTRH
jgi:hypothetical protein